MISLLEWLSRFPVGSSARSSTGSFTNARAMPTRCCSPPESCAGLWPARCLRPTASSAARDLLRAFFHLP